MHGLHFGDREESGATFAGFQRRFLALVIDTLLLLPAFWGTAQFSAHDSRGVRAAAHLAILAIGLLYPFVFHAHWGQTIGKWMAGIKVVRLDGSPLDTHDAALRSSVDFIFAVLGSGLFLWRLLSHSDGTYLLLAPKARAGLGLEYPLYRILQYLSGVWVVSEVVLILFNEKRRALHDYIAGTVVLVVDRSAAVRIPAPAGESSPSGRVSLKPREERASQVVFESEPIAIKTEFLEPWASRFTPESKQQKTNPVEETSLTLEQKRKVPQK